MQIEKTSPTKTTAGPAVSTSRAAEASAADAHFTARQDPAHVPFADLSRWIAAVRMLPEVRQHVVARVLERMAAGYYGTRACAERTAEAMLGSVD